MKKRRILKSVLALLAVTSLAGCGSGSKSEAKTNKTDGLTMWTNFPDLPKTASSWKDYPFLKGLEKETGIKINYEYPSEGTDAAQAFNLMLSEKNLPDMIWYYTMNDADSYIHDGIIQDLTDILPKKAPHYWKFLKEHPEFDRAMKTDSGKYFGFGFFREDPVQTTYMGPMIRKDWLDEQKLPEPKTIDDWENDLKVFNKAYGAKLAFIPATRMQEGFAGAFGAYGTFSSQYYLDNGKVKLAQAQPEWKNYMTWLNKLYKEHLIDPDVITMQEDNDLNTKIANNKVSATFTAGSQLTIINENAKSNKTGAQWIGAQYPLQADGSKSASIFSEDMLPNHAATITTACKGKDLDKALKWLDWAYTKDGYYYWNFGKKGDTWEMKNGVPTFTDKVMKSDLGVMGAVQKYTGSAGAGLGVQAMAATNQRNDKATLDAMNGWYKGNQKAREAIVPTAATLTSKESKEAANLQDTIDNYVLENSLKFMTGEKSLDQFDNFVKKLDDSGLKRLLEIKQNSYERYLKR